MKKAVIQGCVISSFQCTRLLPLRSGCAIQYLWALSYNESIICVAGSNPLQNMLNQCGAGPAFVGPRCSTTLQCWENCTASHCCTALGLRGFWAASVPAIQHTHWQSANEEAALAGDLLKARGDAQFVHVIHRDLLRAAHREKEDRRLDSENSVSTSDGRNGSS